MINEYRHFCLERHAIWLRRQAGEPQPWTDDPILATRKFTSVFRILDPGTQFVDNELLPGTDPATALMRCFLYRHTNLPSAWERFKEETDRYPTIPDLAYMTEFWEDTKVFSGAYMIYPQSSVPGTNKVKSVVNLTQRLFEEENLALDFFMADNQKERFATLRRNKGVADFMSMQILTDIGYSEHLQADENEFIVAGPGAKRGAKAVYPNKTPNATIHRLTDLWEVDGSIRLPVIDRSPSLMDVQNTLCEFSKYLKGPTSKPYRPAHTEPQDITYPTHWRP